MDKKNLAIIIFSVFILVYIMEPVPYCYSYTPDKFMLDEDAIYTYDQTLEIKNLTMTLLNVVGNSMLPTISSASQCLCIEKDKYSLNDIVFFLAKNGDKFQGIIHRIVFMNDGDIYTKGDNNDVFDSPMKKENIVCYVPNVPRYKTLFRSN